MTRPRSVLAAALAMLLCTVAATPLAAAGQAAGGATRIDAAGGPQGGNPDGGGGRFTLQGGARHDSGTMTYSFKLEGGAANAAGQRPAGVKGTIYLNGKGGQLVLVLKGSSLDAVGDGAVTGRDVWTGTWVVDGGTGTYRGTSGTGAYVGIAGPGARLALRLTGHLR